MEDIITKTIERAIKRNLVADKEDVVGIKKLQTILLEERNINLDYSTLRTRVQEYFQDLTTI